jgi:ATP-dependent Clp protease adaptor protein ClpS
MNRLFSNEDYDKKMKEVKDTIKDAADADVDIDVDTDSLRKTLAELGISMSSDQEHTLILWNDHVNDMMSVAVALYEVCKLSNEKCIEVMLEAHTKGKAVVKTGSMEELTPMKKGLNDRNLEVTIE